jgi:hypothetical protein
VSAKTNVDPIVTEVRQAREQFAAEYDYDLDKIFAAMERRQKTSARQYSDRAPQSPGFPKKAG